MRKLLIVCAALAFVVGSSIPAIAADWSFYGLASMHTLMQDVSKERTGTGFDDDDLIWTGMNSTNRFGTKAAAGNIGGHFEVGIDTHYMADANSFHVRLAYGWWNFGAGTLVVGQDYTPALFLPSGSIWRDAPMVLWGGVYPQRVPQLKLKMGGLQVALIEPHKAAPVGGAVDQDTSIPKIEASYSLPVGPVKLLFFAGMNSYEDVAIAGTTETSYDIDSNIFGVGARFGTGPFYVNGDIWFSTNPGNYLVTQDIALQRAALVGTSVEDVDSMVYAAVVGYKVSPMITIEGGMSVISNEMEAGGVTTEYETTFYYIQAPINLAKGFSITPEIGKIDYGDITPGTGKRGEIRYYGARWMVAF
jgi:hypothetical protein